MTKHFYRDKKKGIICGVCSGFSNYFGGSVILIRILFIIFSIFSFGTVFVVYVILAIVTPTDDISMNEDEDKNNKN